MKKLFLVLVLLGFAFSAPAAVAWETWDPSFYAGAGYGYSKVDTGVSATTGTASLDEEDGGFKIFGGFKINRFVGIEVGYTDFGEATLSGNTGDRFSLGGTTYQFLVDGVKISAEATSTQFSAIYFIPLDYFSGNENMSMFEPFVKLGLNLWEIEYSMSASTVSSARADDDGSDLIFGLGLNFKPYERIHFRAEWERYQTEEDIDYFSASVLFNF